METDSLEFGYLQIPTQFYPFLYIMFAILRNEILYHKFNAATNDTDCYNRVMKTVGSPKNREAGLITKCNQIMFSEFSLREQKSSPVFWTDGACLEPI